MATGVAVPIVVIVALISAGTGGDDPGAQHPSASATALPAVSVAAPQETDSATITACAQLISALPLQLGSQKLRLTTSNPPSPSIVAWGDPAVVLRCGVAKPANLTPSYAGKLLTVDGSVLVYDEMRSGDTVFTVVDRTVFLDVSVPSSASAPLGPIAQAVLKVFPKPVCTEDLAGPESRLCTRRK